MSAGVSEQLPETAGNEIVFSGRSNVGKSSLINKLCNRKSLARVSSTPGKTKTINYYSLDNGFYLVDLPGYGYAKRSESEKQRWGALMEHYFTSDRNIKLVVLLLDIRHNPSEDDLIMIDFLMQTNTPFLIVLTKKDKLSNSGQTKNLENFKLLLKPYRPLDIICFSINDESSANNLRNSISSLVKEKI